MGVIEWEQGEHAEWEQGEHNGRGGPEALSFALTP